MVQPFPASKNVPFGGDHLEGVAQPATYCNIHDGHRGAGPTGCVGDGLTGPRDHPVDEGDAGILVGEVVLGAHVVLDAEILLEHLQEKVSAEVGFLPNAETTCASPDAYVRFGPYRCFIDCEQVTPTIKLTAISMSSPSPPQRPSLPKLSNVTLCPSCRY